MSFFCWNFAERGEVEKKKVNLLGQIHLLE